MGRNLLIIYCDHCRIYIYFITYLFETAPDLINRQAVLCHRVLRTIQSVVTNSSIIDQDTWDSLLLLLMTINDVLLAPPTVPSN